MRTGRTQALVNNGIGFLWRNCLTLRIHLRKIRLKATQYFQPLLIGEWWGLNSPNADGFVIQHTPSHRCFSPSC